MADTTNNDLCQGDSNAEGLGYEMQTDSEEMLHAGVNLAERTWELFRSELNWKTETVDRVVCHQVGSAHQKLLFESLAFDVPARCITSSMCQFRTRQSVSPSATAWRPTRYLLSALFYVSSDGRSGLHQSSTVRNKCLLQRLGRIHLGFTQCHLDNAPTLFRL